MATGSNELGLDRTRSRRHRWRIIVAIVATFLAVFGTSSVAYADPEGGTQVLREQLEAAARSYYDTKAILTASQQRQAEITERLQLAEQGLAKLTVEIGAVAAARYKGSQIGVLNGLITGEGDRQTLLQGAAVANYLVWRDDSYLHLYKTTQEDAAKQQQLLNAELEIQAKQLEELDTKKREAEKALASVGGMVSAGYGGPSVDAQPAPRNTSGGLPRESCSINDPTGTGGCLSPRTYHMLNEARTANFTNYVSCWRSSDWGEHPSGRACDFSASKYNFGGVAVDADKDYGDRLAAWGRHNAEALGVMYVIWYKQIWMVGDSGWRVYYGGGDPASDHTNHVHISML